MSIVAPTGLRALEVHAAASIVVWPTKSRKTSSACIVTRFTDHRQLLLCTCATSTKRVRSKRSNGAGAFVSTTSSSVRTPCLNLNTHSRSWVKCIPARSVACSLGQLPTLNNPRLRSYTTDFLWTNLLVNESSNESKIIPLQE